MAQPADRGHRPQQDDTRKEEQRSHGTAQHRSKKDGHATQLGTGQDQHSQRNRGAAARKPR